MSDGASQAALIELGRPNFQPQCDRTGLRRSFLMRLSFFIALIRLLLRTTIAAAHFISCCFCCVLLLFLWFEYTTDSVLALLLANRVLVRTRQLQTKRVSSKLACKEIERKSQTNCKGPCSTTYYNSLDALLTLFCVVRGESV